MTATVAPPGPAPTAERRRGLRARLAAWRPGPWSLRTRILLIFGLGSLALSAFFAVATYNFTRTSLVDQREDASIDQAYDNARRLLADLRSEPPSVQALLERLGAERPLVSYRGTWAGGDARFGPTELPTALRDRVLVQNVPARQLVDIGGQPTLVVGIPLPDVDAAYFEFASFVEPRDTLRSVGIALLIASAITTLLGSVLGAVAANRVVRPLSAASQAAKAMAGGRLDTRLEPSEDPDLRVLTESFNDMAAALQERVERDARFASDVSHELRSPLMTLSASVEVMQARRDDLPERAQAALDLLVADVARFQGLVEDLLEISRFDAGAVRLNLEDLLVGEFVRQAVAVSSLPSTPVTVDERAESLLIRGDRRRLARVMANLIDNGRIHGGGELEVTVQPHADGDEPIDHVWIVVEDHGPGVAPEDRGLVFERFARGGVAGRRAGSEGAGLGLALVDEHVRLHGGRVWVEDRHDGQAGARFVIELPAEQP